MCIAQQISKTYSFTKPLIHLKQTTMNYTSINLTSLKNYDATLISDYLKMHPSRFYEIIIPKEPVNKEPDEFSIFYQYALASFAGQLLYNSSVSFSYKVPWPYSDQPFQFELEIENKEDLAKALAYIIEGYFTHDDEMLKFALEAAEYFDNAFIGETVSDIWGLLFIAGQYI